MLKKLKTAAKVGVYERKFEPYFPTTLTKWTPFSSRALNYRSRIYGQRGGTLK